MFQLKPLSREKIASFLSKGFFIFFVTTWLCVIIGYANSILTTLLHPSPLQNVTAAPPIVVQIISSPKTSDINVEFSGYEQRSSIFNILEFRICFDLPEEEKWSPRDVFLKIGNEEISPMLISLDTNNNGMNCQGIIFSIDSIHSQGKAELSIGQLSTYFSKELRNCDKAQKKLNEAKTGIVIACDSDWSGIASSFEILEKPQNMNEEEARERVNEEFLSVIQVDWKFMFLIEKP